MKNIDLKALHLLSLKDLRKAKSLIDVATWKAEYKAANERTLSRLVKVKVPRGEVTAADRRRFTGGFFREQRPSGNLGGRLYAETKTGILYVQDRFGKSWEKVA